MLQLIFYLGDRRRIIRQNADFRIEKPETRVGGFCCAHKRAHVTRTRHDAAAVIDQGLFVRECYHIFQNATADKSSIHPC